jgi:hypothetical protein
MTPKEKANNLVLKYEKYLFDRFTTDEDWVKCVECALIAIDEMIAELAYVRKDNIFLDKEINARQNYLIKVQKEIEKL